MSTKETSKRILAAGGNVALVGTINLNQKDELVRPARPVIRTRRRNRPAPSGILDVYPVPEGGESVWQKLYYKTAKRSKARLRRFKRKVQQEDIIKEIKRHSFYLKPGEKRRTKEALARKRNRKKRRSDIE